MLILIFFIIAYIVYQSTHTFDYHIFRFSPFFILGYIIKRENVNIHINLVVFLVAISLYVLATYLGGGYAEILQFQNIGILFLFVIQGQF